MAKYLYNGVLLPEIPTGNSAYPHVFIRDNADSGYYDLMCASGIWYLSAENTLSHNDTNPVRWYRIEKTAADIATEWVHHQWYESSAWGIAPPRVLVWSNHDIPNGSVDSTEIYFYGSEPVDPNAPEEPTEEVYYKISGERLKGFADQARRLGEVTGELTPEQIEDTLRGVEAGGASAFAVLISDIPANHIVAECNLDYFTDFKEETE